MSIEQKLNLKLPADWSDFAIEKEFAEYLMNKIIEKRPVNVVELGSGMSSLIILKTLKKLGYKYNFISVDSDMEFLEKTRSYLISEDVYDERSVKLLFSPIEEINLNGNLYKWYSKKDFNFTFEKIDFLFIDGPVGGFCKNSRYPAINLMRRYLKKGSIVTLHDAKRPDEVNIINMWRKENSDIKIVNTIKTERGGAEIQF